jgi:gas vesicle protein
MRLPILALFCSAVALLAAGCGGSSNRLSHAQFQAKANHICSQLNKQEQADLSSNTKGAVDRNLTRINSAIGQLKGLRPPADNEARYQELLKSFEQTTAFVRANESQLIELTRKLRASAQDSQDFARYRRLVRPYLQQLRIAGADATALGLTACAKGLTGSSSNG